MLKRKAYTVCEKLDLVTRIQKGESQCKVSWEMRVPESTLQGWLKDEMKLREFLINVCAASVNSYAHVPLLISRLLFSMSITQQCVMQSVHCNRLLSICIPQFYTREFYSVKLFDIFNSIQCTLTLIFYFK